jgi:hypothetical protein
LILFLLKKHVKGISPFHSNSGVEQCLNFSFSNVARLVVEHMLFFWGECFVFYSLAVVGFGYVFMLVSTLHVVFRAWMCTLFGSMRNVADLI